LSVSDMTVIPGSFVYTKLYIFLFKMAELKLWNRSPCSCSQ